MRNLNLFLRSRLAFAFLLFISATLYSQDIINTEKYDFNLKKKFNLGATFNYNAERGNTFLNEFESELLGSYTINNNIFRLIGGYNFLNSKVQVLKKNYFLQLRHNYKFTDHLQSFLFYQLQQNEILRINKRELMGAGARIVTIAEDTAKFKCDIGIGAMYENEVLDLAATDESSSSENHNFRMSDFLSLRYKLKTLEIISITYYQPRLDEFADFRVHSDLSVTVKISKLFSFITGILYRYDSMPPEELKNWDISFRNGILLKL